MEDTSPGLNNSGRSLGRKHSFSGMSHVSVGAESYGGFSKNTTGSVASILSSSRVPSSARLVAKARREKESDFVLSLNLSELTLAEGMEAVVRIFFGLCLWE